jgi:hypothetical protein
MRLAIYHPNAATKTPTPVSAVTERFVRGQVADDDIAFFDYGKITAEDCEGGGAKAERLGFLRGSRRVRRTLTKESDRRG